MDVPEELPPALACLVGYFGYETIGLVEKLPRAPQSELELPDMLFVRPTVILVFDRLKDEMFLVAPVWTGAEDTRAVELANERLDEAERLLDKPSWIKPVANRSPTISTPFELNPVLPPGRYREMVLRAKDYIAAGDIFQVVLAQRFTAPFALPPVDLYRALRRINPSPFLYFLDLPDFAIVGSSPEILVRARGGEVTIRPIAGTRPRGKNSIEDAENRASLLADPKERAEHLMLLDLGRNDVGRVTKGGSVTVTDSYMVEFYSHVMHIVSNVVGELAPMTRTPSTPCSQASPPAPSAARPRSAPAKSSPNSNPKRAEPMQAASAISRPMAIWTAASSCAPASSKTACSTFRQAQASSPTATPNMNSASARRKRAR